MTRFTGWAISAGLMLAASAANAQMPASYRAVSDFDAPYERPYGAMPPAPPPLYSYGGYAPALLPPHEVYAVLRDNGFLPLGIPHQRGLVYTIAVLDRNGEDGRLVIDARNGRIIRFMPAYGYAPYSESLPLEPMSGHGPEVALPPPTVIRGMPRPPAPVPHVASRAVPLPAPKPDVAARPGEPAQRSAAIETRPVAPAARPNPPTAPSAQAPQAGASPPVQASISPPANAAVGEARPAPAIRPTQQMPAAQGLE